jgi:hypothetical protein
MENTMNIPELQQERQRRRAQKRRAAIDRLNGAVALDAEDLLNRLEEQSTAQYSPVIRRTMLIREAVRVIPDRARVAARFRLTDAELERELSRPLLAPPQLALDIDAQVVAEIPATRLTLDALAPADREVARRDPEALVERR